MAHLPFNMALMQFLADHRNVALTRIFLAATFAGEVEGYILIVTFIYVVFDKSLAIRLSVLLLLTMCLNHILKIIIKNPRPFVRERTYLKKWAISSNTAKELVTEYSTPSGHAMAGAAFYTYLYVLVNNRYVRVIAVLAILLTGLSRPYLGVHYLEDILIGWVIGLCVALVAVKFADEISDEWDKLPYTRQVGIGLAASMALWLVTIAINGWRIDGQPRAFLGYAGALTGIVIAVPLELANLNFDPGSSNVASKILRYIISVCMVIATLWLLGAVFEAIADNFSVLGYLLQYVRYTIAGIVNMFLAPLCFTKLGLARTNFPIGMPLTIGSAQAAE
ncbi:MAG: phosphatase PAP2 family protein [Candidatus Binataceae bacterium]